MDLIFSFKKYIENIKTILLVSVLFIFTLFLVNPLFVLVGGSLDLSYNILLENVANIIISLISVSIFVVCYTLMQTIIIYKVEDTYNFEKYDKGEIKSSFYELLKFNIFFYLFIFLLSAYLYSINMMNSIFLIILTLISIVFWFIPQIIILEKEKAIVALIINYNYIKRNYIHLIYLFISSFILILITYIIETILGGFAGSLFSTIFFVLFVIPFIEILKTEVYLDKYNLLKPIW